MATEFDDGRLRITSAGDPPVLRVEGEVDAGGRAALARALREALDRAPGRDLRVDLGGLQGIDLGGLRALADAGRAAGEGRVLVLDPLPHRVRVLLELTGWAGGAGLRLGGSGPPEEDGERPSG
ncbi:STAS domain-containing protein [Actinomadura parmotrematis]|uniref:STAS domain-containing protein n=1 Tax=Actinomadura parmotrematis TaxID=2864039 RepID=A0ABS7G3N7_9ACTN|nr:STAS domain-containing protein [Actinomadura parmotrematis]MBW8487156.1 STAS domain-containing protein [Actinomadura parmotrematis]